LCGKLREQFILTAPNEVRTQDQRLVFSRWDRRNPGSESWEPISESATITVALVDGAAYRAVYVAGQTGTTTPTTPTTQPCLTVSAIYAYQQIGTARLSTTPQTVEQAISIPVVVNGSQTRNTQFQLCAAAGTRFTLQVSQYAYTETQARVIFSHWERYNTSTQAWDAFAENLTLQVTLQQGGQLRAVYRPYVD